MLEKLTSPWGLILAFAILSAGLGLLAAVLRLTPPMWSFSAVLGGSTVGGLAALVLAWSHRSETSSLVLFVILGAVLLSFPGGLVVRSVGKPAIHDLTTRPDDPPRFDRAAAAEANQGRDLSYPEGPDDTAELQQQHYPDLAPLQLEAPPERVLEVARRLAIDRGWELYDSAALPEDGFEAWHQTSIFGFVDDIRVRVRPASGGGTVLDIRSTSRDGTGDMGFNAKRIRTFSAAVREAIQ